MTGKADELNLNSESFPLERYEPIALLGRGGIGEVYLAQDLKLARRVAVKCLMSVDDETIVIFHREAKIASKLHHPNIVGTLDFGTTEGGRPFIAFEYFNGTSVDVLLEERGGRFDEKFVRKLFTIVAKALSYIHEHNVFHRDLKPSNIMVNLEDPDNMQLRVIDFGVSAIKEDIQNRTLVQGKTIVGTPVYMSPDPVRGDEFDARSEVYSIGCIMFECLAGEPPFDAPSTAEVLELHIHSEPPLLEESYPDIQVSSELQQIIDKCLAKDKDERFQTMAELAEALEAPYASPQAEPLFEQMPPAAEVTPSRGFPVGIAIGAVIFLVGAGIVTVSILNTSASKTDLLKTSEAVKELTEDRRMRRVAEVEEQDVKDDTNANGAYISGARGIKKLKRLVAENQRKKMVTLNNLTITKPLLLEVAVLQPQIVKIFNLQLTDKEPFEQMHLVQSVRELDFHACGGITPDDIAALSDMPRLTSLLLVGCLITDKHLEAMAKNKRLEKVVLDGNKDVTMKGLLFLSRKPNEKPILVWVSEGELTGTTPQKIDELRKKNNIILSPHLPSYEGEGGDGLIHTDALELIE
jgi:serine/threonine protein kinase